MRSQILKMKFQIIIAGDQKRKTKQSDIVIGGHCLPAECETHDI